MKKIDNFLEKYSKNQITDESTLRKLRRWYQNQQLYKLNYYSYKVLNVQENKKATK